MKSLGSYAKVKRILKKNYGIAGRRVGITLAKEMRKAIRGGKFEPNSRFTIAFKGSTKPLAGPHGRLFKAITYKVKGVSDLNNAILIGVMKENTFANIAKAVHDGAKIKVKARMSMLFKAVLAAARGRGMVRSRRGLELLHRFRDDATISAPRVGSELIIPPRPFAKVVAESSKTKELIAAEYRKALARIVAELAK